MVMIQRRQKGFISSFFENLSKQIKSEEDFQKSLEELKEHETSKAIKSTTASVAKSAQEAKDKVVEKATEVNEGVIKPSYQKTKEVAKDIVEPVVEGARRVGEQVDSTVNTVKSTKAYQKTAETVVKATEAIEKTAPVRAAVAVVESLEQEKLAKRSSMYFDEPPPELRRDEVPESELNTSEMGIIMYTAPETAFQKGLNKLAKIGPVKRALDTKVVSGVVNTVGNAVTAASETMDSISNRIFPHSEGAEVIRLIRLKDPKFQPFEFVNFLRDRVCAEVIQAFLDGDLEYLKKKCGEKAFAVVKAHIKAREAAGMFPDNRILNITQVELQKAILTEDEQPVIIISFVCQQVHAYYNTKKKLVEGAEDDIRAVHYVWALQPDEKFSDLRWRISEMAIHGAIKLLS